jgi:hypothetical protein
VKTLPKIKDCLGIAEERFWKVGNCQVPTLFFHNCYLTDKVLGSISIFGEQKTLPSLVLVHSRLLVVEVAKDSAQNEIGI